MTVVLAGSIVGQRIAFHQCPTATPLAPVTPHTAAARPPPAAAVAATWWWAPGYKANRGYVAGHGSVTVAAGPIGGNAHLHTCQ